MEGPFVGCGVAEVEGEQLLVGNFAGLLIETSFLEAIGSVEEPAVLGHRGDEQRFGGVGGGVIVGELLEEVVVGGLAFAG